jgi:cell division septal protein FtsQ
MNTGKKVIIFLIAIIGIVLGLMIGKAVLADISFPDRRINVVSMEHIGQYDASISVAQLNRGRING